jgi:carbon-monoxide dehydrogenase medium subunit
VILEPLEYTAPTTIAGVLAALAGNPDARLLAGGQGLVAGLQTGDETAGALVDLRKVAALRGIRTTSAGLEIGSLTTLDEIATDPLVRTTAPALAEAAGAVGDPQIRNRATIGGNLASRGTDLPAVALALDVRVRLDGDRDLSAEEYFSAGSGLITGIVVRAGRSAFEKLAHRAITQPVSAVGVELTMGRAVEAVRIGLSGPTPLPVRLRQAEEALVGTDGGREAVSAAFAALPSTLFDGSPGFSAEYLRHVTGVLAGRAVRRILAT